MADSPDDHSASELPSEYTTSSASSVDDEHGTDPGDIKDDLVDLLSGLKTSGSFATSNKVSGDVVTGLSVHNVGRIGFPLSPHQAKEIVGVCHPAPFGQGSQTIVDESVRKTWELNPDQLTLDGPTWPSKIDQIAQQASRDLGCPPEVKVKANLYKLLLYEKGALFKPHKDTEKEPGMFATLVIALPSEYEGGKIVTTHREESKILRVEHPAFFHNYMAWYADVTHEVRPVTSGYRLALVYNLINDSSQPTPSASLAIREKRELGGILSSWSEAIQAGAKRAPERLVYALDHQYTDASLNLQALKGLDKVRAEYLIDTCHNANVCFYLGSMELRKYGNCDEDDDGEEGYGNYGRGYGRKSCTSANYHVIDDVAERDLALKRIVDVHGNVLAVDVAIDDDDLAQDDPFSEDPDDEEYEGYTGNAGATAIHWYRDTVFVLIPLASRSTFLENSIKRGLVNVDEWLQQLIQSFEADSSNGFARRDLSAFIYLVLRTRMKAANPKFSGPRISCLLYVSTCLKDKRLFEATLDIYVMKLCDFREMGRAACILDVGHEHVQVNRVFEERKTFHTRYQAVRKFMEGYNKDRHSGMNEMRAWALRQYTSAVGLLRCRIRDDGICLAELTVLSPDVLRLEHGLQARGFERNTAFLAAFLSTVVRLKVEGAFTEAVANQTFSEVLQILLPDFNVECRRLTKRSEPDSDAQSATCLINAHDMGFLLLELYRKDCRDEINTIISKLGSEAQSCEVVAFEAFYLPLLTRLLKSDMLSHVYIYSLMFIQVLTLYLNRYVQIPPPATTWKRAPEGCGCCTNCNRLDRFLVDPKLKSKDFAVGRGERHHLHSMLNDTRHSHVTDRLRNDTLVVTKGMSGSDAKRAAWEKRFKSAREKIADLNRQNPKVLQELLREEYDALTKRCQPRGASDRERSSQPIRPPQRSQPTIIDLTDT